MLLKNKIQKIIPPPLLDRNSCLKLSSNGQKQFSKNGVVRIQKLKNSYFFEFTQSEIQK